MARKSTILLLLKLLLPLGSHGQKACPKVRVEARRLADLHVPRAMFNAFCVNGEVTVVGGHTDGFIPTATSEYYRDGAWHLMNMTYTHDSGIALPLDSGRVLLAGGLEKNLGIGQTFEVEMYDARSHTFTGFGCLSQKRAMASATRLQNKTAAIAGNWYSKDDSATIELYDIATGRFSHLKTVSQRLAAPYVLPISPDDALILGNVTDRGQVADTVVAERLHGPSFRVPLFDHSAAMAIEIGPNSDDCFIGDKRKGDYAYLLPRTDMEGQLEIILMRDTTFQLLPTASPIPRDAGWGRILYSGYPMIDRQRHRAYVHGIGKDRRHYVLAIAYGTMPARLTLYYTEPLEGGIYPVLTPEGNVMLIGGTIDNNFAPSAAVWLLPLAEGDGVAESSSPSWLWLLLPSALLLAVAIFLLRRRRTAAPQSEIEAEPEVPSPEQLLMERIDRQMTQEQLFLKPDLKVQDLADALHTNSRYISDCIKSQRNSTFASYVNTYRIGQAQKLMHSRPDMKLITVSEASGFAGERTFFRTFKLHTGMTPKEWMEQQGAQESTDNN